MNSARKNAVVAILVMSIAGCAEKNAKTVPPAQAQAPSIDAGKAGAMYPPPFTPAAPQTETLPPAPAPVVTKAEPPPPPPAPPVKTKKPQPSTHKAKPSPAKPSVTTPAATETTDMPATATPTQPATGTPATTAPATDPPTLVASGGEPAAASPIGQLSTGDVSGRAQTRKETVDTITNTESGLNGIKRSLNAQEQETANQIKTFLTKAKTALANDDLDGALILATKAKVLLDELNKT